MRNHTFASLLTAILILPSESASQSQDNSFQRVEEKFFERLEDHGRVSGDIIMGVMIRSLQQDQTDQTQSADAAPRTTAELAVLALPAFSQGEETRYFCVRINSKDGRFESENTYEITGNLTVPQGLIPYEGTYEQDVSEMKAVSLIKLGRCGNRAEVMVPSAWADSLPTPPVRALQVFVNAAGNPTAAAVGNNGDIVTCENVIDETTLKYTASCLFPFKTLQSVQKDGQVPLTFYVTRSLGEEEHSVIIAMPEVDS
ncbi:hypothetical protein [uncultured Roseobacter sp.]|uniref:hypothetical protein n=1 Tax=uncultured Roseobacter sp. TaxID=114847 RepID=UPI00261BF84E|nr:hypothetical protein [uncultured Roseobacter sp.]